MSKISLINNIESPPKHGSNIVLDLVNNPASQTILLGNNLQSKFSQFFQKKYDIGAVEWRMLVALARAPDSTMTTVTEMIEMDKAAVSRALAKLDEKRLAHTTPSSTHARSKLWRLTPAGIALHDVILNATIVHIKKILEGIPEESIIAMSEAMAAMKRNAENVDWES